jgi:hypothetical protein
MKSFDKPHLSICTNNNKAVLKRAQRSNCSP